MLLPTTIILAPGSGKPLSSVTFPFTVVCAKVIAQQNRVKILKIVLIGIVNNIIGGNIAKYINN